ncbi:hypothetical protein [Spiribacter roseus]|uniref:hypothetical protein n=1 Tax=Spiribacter roseus TaxID=1855875 RepID=UPI002E0EFBC3
MELCGNIIPTPSTAKYDPDNLHRCYRLKNHTGRCKEYPYLDHMHTVAPGVRQKIIRDATKTTGASWKSSDAGPNRISRWTMLLSDDELLQLGISMSALKQWVQDKLREKAAPYEDCMAVAQKLTWLAYGMRNAPPADDWTRDYLESLFGTIPSGDTGCFVCLKPLDFELFHKARRGKAEIETGHRTPRSHTAENTGFTHRECNIAQGPLTVDEFYDWMENVLSRARPHVLNNPSSLPTK